MEESFTSKIPEAIGSRETRVVTMVSTTGLEIKIIGALHVGTVNYYKNILKECNGKGIVLYEKVKGAAKKIGLLYGIRYIDTSSFYKNFASWINKKLQSGQLNGSQNNFYQEDFIFVTQSEGIDYKNLPQSRIHSDAYLYQLDSLPIFSKDNAVIFLAACFLKAISYKPFQERVFPGMLKRIANRGVSSTKGPLDKIDETREQILFNKVEEYIKLGASFSILYGEGHVENILDFLARKGFRERQTKKLTAIPQLISTLG